MPKKKIEKKLQKKDKNNAMLKRGGNHGNGNKQRKMKE